MAPFPESGEIVPPRQLAHSSRSGGFARRNKHILHLYYGFSCADLLLSASAANG
jgi:hypothetical protein